MKIKSSGGVNSRLLPYLAVAELSYGMNGMTVGLTKEDLRYEVEEMTQWDHCVLQ